MVTIDTHNGSESSGDELGGTTSANPFLHQEAANPSQATNHPQRVHLSDDEPSKHRLSRPFILNNFFFQVMGLVTISVAL